MKKHIGKYAMGFVTGVSMTLALSTYLFMTTTTHYRSNLFKGASYKVIKMKDGLRYVHASR